MKKYLFLLLLCCVTALSAQTISQKRPPKIGLVLAGGGAKGIAEIGVIKVLEEAGIRPDYITGTSIGSIVGGLYASGYTVDDLYQLAHDIDWNYYFNDAITRVNYPVIERGDSDKYILSFPLEDGKLKLPRGAVLGKKINLLFSRLTAHHHYIDNFDDFPIPFRCIATDFSTGEAVILRDGCLPDAMRASMSIPSIFEPVLIKDRLLIDGLSARNMPVQDVIDMGADIVIAVDIGSPLLTDEEFKTPLDVMVQSSSYLINQINEKQRELADILIEPDVDKINPLDFNKADTLLARGERAARAALPKILELIPSKKLEKRENVLGRDSFKINAISIQHYDNRQYNFIRNQLQIRIGETYSIYHIEKRLNILLGSQLLKQVRYRLQPLDDGHELIIQSEYQKGNFVRIGAHYDSNLKAGLLVNATLRNLLMPGSKLSVDARISEYPALLTDYILYLKSARPSIGLKFGGKANFYPADFYADGNLQDFFDINHYVGRFDVFSDINNRWLVKFGAGIEQYAQARALFVPNAEELRLKQNNAYIDLVRDTYDRLNFPRAGSIAAFHFKFSFGGSLKQTASNTTLKNDKINGLARAYFKRVFPVKKAKILWGIDSGISAYANNNFLTLFYLGRHIPYEVNFVDFAGLDYMELPATAYLSTSLKFRLEPKNELFTSLILNYGYYDVRNFLIADETGGATQTTATSGRIWGSGLELGYMSPLGPIKVNGEYNFFSRRVNFALHIGHYF